MAVFKTPEATIVWPSLFQARINAKAPPGSPAYYSAVFLFTPAAMATEAFKALRGAAIAECVAKLGADRVKGLLADRKLNIGIRDDVVSSKYPSDYGCFIRAKSKNKPGVVSRYADPKTGKPAVITDSSEIYPGAKVYASMSPFYFDQQGNRGVSFWMNNVQKIGDGPVTSTDADELAKLLG
jgi:hypothetical protein